MLCAILQSDHRQALPRLQQPVLLLQTQRDSFVPLTVAEYMVRTLPHAELRMLDAQGICRT
jgi:sigma-B regulation protein RsbQ